MKLRNLSGKQIVIETKPSEFPMRSKESCRSNIQFECGQLIKQAYPNDPILEDVPIPTEKFYFDFWLPRRKIAFEIQGEQHGNYVPFFHGSRGNFLKAKERDFRKVNFCQINEITLHLIDSLDQLRELLNERN